MDGAGGGGVCSTLVRHWIILRGIFIKVDGERETGRGMGGVEKDQRDARFETEREKAYLVYDTQNNIII